MKIGGLQKFSLLDYPGQIAAIIFTQGCNFRCQFCYNPMLVWPDANGGKAAKIAAGKKPRRQKGHSLINEDDLFAFLETRTGKLDAVVISGGEPTLQSGLPAFLGRIKRLGYKVKLDTNGTNPAMLEAMAGAGLIDYIAMDIKAPLSKYEAVTSVRPDLKKIQESVRIIIGGDIPHEFRTTLAPELFAPGDIAGIGALIRGAQKWYLQKFKSDTGLVNPSFEGRAAFTDAEMAAFREEGRRYVENCETR